MVFLQSWCGIVTNASKMRCEKFGGLTFCALVAKLVKKGSHDCWEILVGNCHKRIQNKVWKVWLQKELILVRFWLSHVGCIGLLWLASKISEKVKSWFLSNLVGEVSEMYAKGGVKILVAKGIYLGWVLVFGLAFCALVAKLVNKWSHCFWAILMGNCHKFMQNEVWKVWFQKELILVGFCLTQVRWIGLFLPW